MKKVILLIVMIFFLTGCMNVNKSSYDEIIYAALNSEKIELKNASSQGYSYYLPKGLSVVEDNKNNVILKTEKYSFYLYLDLISYFNKIEEEYKIKSNVYYSSKINYKGKFGYLEINLKENNKYLIEIMYNYAKIEVIVDDKSIREALSYAMSLLSSISYNDTIIANLIGEDVLNYNEIEFNIFETAKNESSLIEYDEDSASSDSSNAIPDTDLIN